MEPEPLLFFDSGVGGLPYLSMTRSRLPGEHYVYIADRRNFPYGEKPADELRGLVVETMGKALRRFRPKLVVVACNTASVVALGALRQCYPVPFVGVVPAVKPAAEEPAGGRLAVVATRGTVSGEYLRQLIQDFAANLEVESIPVGELVDYVENNPPPRDPHQDEAAVRRQLSAHLRDGVGTVVLGCTHFTLLDQAFRRVLGPQVRLIDSREGVTRRVVSLLEQSGSRRPSTPPGRARLFLHGGSADRTRYAAFAAAFDLQLAGELDRAAELDRVGEPTEPGTA